MLIDDEYIDLSLSQKDTLIHQRVVVLPRPEIPMRPGMPKKTRLERLPEYFEQTYDRRQHETAVICGTSQLTYQELDHRANRLAHLLISRGVGEGNPVLLNGYASTSPFETRAISEFEAKTSKLRMLNQMSFKNVYKHVMTDPLYKNSLFNMAGTFILGTLGFVFWIIIARLYKTEQVGVATTLISIMALLSSLTILGLGSSL
jgi:hypothetical protein